MITIEPLRLLILQFDRGSERCPIVVGACHIRLWSLVVLLLCCGDAWCFSWDIEPELNVQELYSDNILLSPSGFENDDYVTDASPGVSIRGDGNRVDLRADYRIQNLIYAKDSDLDETFHIFSGDASVELIKDFIFVDSRSRFSQQNVSNIGNVSLDNVSQSGERSDVLTYVVNPYIVRRFGSWVEAQIGYTFDQVNVAQGMQSDSRSHRVEAELGNPSRGQRINWDLSFDRRDVSYDRGNDSLFQTTKGGIEYEIVSKLSLRAEVGYDDNDFEGVQGDTDDVLWNVGVEWTPNRRLSLDFHGGQRFFGTDLDGSISYRTRKIELSASYSEEPSTTRQTFLDRDAFPLQDPFGNDIPVGTSDPALTEVNVEEQTAEVLVYKRFEMDFRYSMRRHVLDAHAFQRTREFQVSGNKQDAAGVDLTWTWLIGPRTSARMTASYSQDEQLGGRDDVFERVDVNLSRQLTRTMAATLGYRYFARESDVRAAVFDEQRLWVHLVKQF